MSIFFAIFAGNIFYGTNRGSTQDVTIMLSQF